MVLLMYHKFSNHKIRKIILRKLRNRGCWGASYFPLATLVNWLSKKVKKNGKRIRNVVDQLVKEGYLIYHKKGATISLNPAKSREIVEYIHRA
jgi:hypothetical protein